MAYYIISLGSNKGNRRLNLSRAMRLVGERFGEFEISHVVESKSWGYDSPHPYLNAVMMFRSDEQPLDVLDALQEIERAVGGNDDTHRDAGGNYTDRIMDIDILAADDLVLDTERLTLPHPRLHLRSFCLEPMQEIAGGWRHPLTGLTPAQMAAQLPSEDE